MKHDTRASKSLLQLIAEEGMAKVLGKLLRFHDAEYKYKFAQELEKIKTAYETTAPGYAHDVLLGTYKLLSQKYEHTFGERFEHAFHRRIQQEVRDKQAITNYRRKNGGNS